MELSVRDVFGFYSQVQGFVWKPCNSVCTGSYIGTCSTRPKSVRTISPDECFGQHEKQALLSTFVAVVMVFLRFGDDFGHHIQPVG